ncbi:MAG TPA: hypothetical protein VMV74_13300, partial [Bacteroidales bacterium]|nr:hypothetical protein [Bacteroidales bacterium]
MIRKTLFATLLICSFTVVNGQNDFRYQLPPEAIVKIIDAPQTPGVMVSPDNKTILLLERPGLVSIAELSAPELRIAGLRLDPRTNSQSRGQSVNRITAMNIDGTNLRSFTGMPAAPEIGGISWADDSKRFTFTNITGQGVELWVADLATMAVTKIDDGVNNIFRGTSNWLPDGSFIYLRTLRNRGKAPEASQTPKGPVVQETSGKQGESRTFQDLLKNVDDEAIFEYFATSELVRWNGTGIGVIGKKGMITDVSPSTDGQWLMVNTIERPFSYLVPYSFFPTRIQIWDLTGKVVKELLYKPLQENLPRGYDAVNPGPRNHSWRADKPASLLWVEALDGGDYYAREMKYHDQVWLLETPFTAEPQPFLSVEKRIQRITWGNDNLAVVSEGLSKSRVRVTSTFSPADPQNTIKKIHELNSDDRYGNPGSFMTALNSFGRQALLTGDKGKSLYLSGTGSSPEGDRPFIDKYDIKTGKTTRLWRSEAPYYETISEFINPASGLMLTVRQSVSEVPNYYIRDLKKGTLTQVTKFENPYPELSGVKKELVKYKRNDGVDLSFT